jgi:DNA-binding response OmpR family regulator
MSFAKTSDGPGDVGCDEGLEGEARWLTSDEEPRVVLAGDLSPDLYLSSWFLSENGFLPVPEAELDDVRASAVDAVLFNKEDAPVGRDGRISRLKRKFRVPLLCAIPWSDETGLRVLTGLDVNDVVFKPLRFQEVVSRLRVLVYRWRSGLHVQTATPAAGVGKLLGDTDIARDSGEDADLALHIDERRKSIVFQRRRLRLTPKEFELFSLLASDPGRVFSKEDIISRLWPVAGKGSVNDLHQCVRRLRKKTERDPSRPLWIKTAPGFGYTLDLSGRVEP